MKKSSQTGNGGQHVLSTSFKKLVLVTVSLLFLWISFTNALMCYQCGGTSLENECFTDHQGLVNTSLNLTDYYAKDCTATNPNWTRCMIETRESNGKTTLFHRGCHDGVTFPKEHQSPRFNDLPANNYSTCAQIQLNFICYRFCDTNYCNGPLAPEKEIDACKILEDDPYAVLPGNLSCGAMKLGNSEFTMFTFTLWLVLLVFVQCINDPKFFHKIF